MFIVPAGSSLLHGLFSSCGKWGLLFVAVWGLLDAVASLVTEHRLEGTWTSVVAVHGLRSTGSINKLTSLVALWHVGSSWTRDQTGVSCIGRQILYN